ncbi:MAG: DUF1330 domain-containing protein [Pseudomonadota bacterium]
MSDTDPGALMIIQATITDPGRFAEYAKRTPALVSEHGGRYIAMRSEVQVLEGAADDRKVVISAWPSLAAARAFWDSDAYAELKALRAGAADVQVTLVQCKVPAPS